MSDILKSVHKTALGLKQSGAIDKTIMGKFDAICLPHIQKFSAEQVRNLRMRKKDLKPSPDAI